MGVEIDPVVRDESTTGPSAGSEGTSIRTGVGVDAIAAAVIDNLECLQGRSPRHATVNDWYVALAYTARDRLLNRFVATAERAVERKDAVKIVAYLSAEFLTGPHLRNSLINLGIHDAAEQALSALGQ